MIFNMSIIVRAGANDSTDSVIRKFQKIVAQEKVIQKYREMTFYEKKSERRQKEKAEKMRKIMRARRLAQ